MARKDHWRSIALVTSTVQASRARQRMMNCFSGHVYVVTVGLPWFDWPGQIAGRYLSVVDQPVDGSQDVRHAVGLVVVQQECEVGSAVPNREALAEDRRMADDVTGGARGPPAQPGPFLPARPLVPAPHEAGP